MALTAAVSFDLSRFDTRRVRMAQSGAHPVLRLTKPRILA